MPAVIASDGTATAARGLSSGDAPSSSVMSLTNKGAESKAPASVPAFLFEVASLYSAAIHAPRLLPPQHRPQPSHLSPKCPDHAAEAAENPEPLPDIVHYHIENGGVHQVPLMIYVENTKALEIIANRSRNPNKWSHS